MSARSDREHMDERYGQVTCDVARDESSSSQQAGSNEAMDVNGHQLMN